MVLKLKPKTVCIPFLLLLILLGCEQKTGSQTEQPGEEFTPPSVALSSSTPVDTPRYGKDTFRVGIDPEKIRFENEIRNFEREDSVNPNLNRPILFTGSSSIRKWSSLREDMAPLPVLNRGFGGAVIDQVNYYAPRYLYRHFPPVIVFYCGENDIAWDRDSPEKVLKSFQTFVRLVRAWLPGTKILFISIKPSPLRWKDWPTMQKGNALIEAYTKAESDLDFIDVSKAMLDDNGKVRPEIFIRDRLHLNEEGYAAWTALVRPRLMKLVKELNLYTTELNGDSDSKHE